MNSSFNRWLDTFVEEKGLDLEQVFDVVGPSGPNWIPLGVIVEAMKTSTATEQAKIKTTIVAIDFRNGDTLHFFRHLANALAI